MLNIHKGGPQFLCVSLLVFHGGQEIDLLAFSESNIISTIKDTSAALNSANCLDRQLEIDDHNKLFTKLHDKTL